MSRHRHILLALALGSLGSACDDPDADETSDELGTETSDDAESDGGTETSGTDTSGTETSGTETSGTETSETETDTGEMPIAGCECILDEAFDGQVVDPSLPTCGEPLCDQIEVGEEQMIMNPETVDCALMALRDRTPGILTWHYSLNILVESSGYIQITEDGRAIHRRWSVDDKSFQISDAELGELRVADDYDACLAEPEAIMRYYCVVEDLASVDGVCNEGWSDF